MNLPSFENLKIAILGLGYVGLPLAIEFEKKKFCYSSQKEISRKVIGFDINPDRISELINNYDRTNEISQEELKSSQNIKFTHDKSDLNSCDLFIITVPTPIDDSKIPNLNPLINASQIVGRAIKERNKIISCKSKPVIVYESTVFPGATEEICIKEIEKISSLSSEKNDFFFGYSPERINPGDKKNSLTNIKKLTSGNSEMSAKWIDDIYASIINAGTYKCQSIKVAEAAKVIENTQRDINIALVNEFSLIFSKLNIDTLDVLEAAGTKWNFLKFTPGLVGGHCIGVDPYYLTYKAQKVGYHPEVLLSGRRINDSMGIKFVDMLILKMARNSQKIKDSKLLILGITFKENCPDIRNTGVISIVSRAKEYGFSIDIVDPFANQLEAKKTYHLDINNNLIKGEVYDAVIVAVKHNQFLEISTQEWAIFTHEKTIIMDPKGIVPRDLNPVRP